MKRIVVGLLAVCLMGSLTVLAEEKATTEKAAKSQEMTVMGKLAKDVKAGFSIVEADGTMVIVKTQKAAKEGGAAVVDPVVDLEKWVGKEVKLVGKGTTKTKAGKTTKTIKVTSIEEAAAPAAATEAPAAAPATAPAAAPAAAPEAK